MAAPEPEDLRALGRAARRSPAAERASGTQRPPPTQLGIAFRFATELVAALLVGGGIGMGPGLAVRRSSDIHTRPLFIVVMFVLGAAAGIRNVMRAANEMNAEIAATPRHRSTTTRRTRPVAMNPMEQFEIKPIVPLHIGGYDVSFTNQSLAHGDRRRRRLSAVPDARHVASAASCRRARSRWPRCPTNSSPT